MSFDRYSRFRINGQITKIPMVTLTEKDSDRFIVYKAGVTRLDNVSYEHYGDANYDWLIMLANREYGSLEFNIPDGATLRIPWPLSLTLEDYNNQVEKYITLYGLD